MSSSAWSQIDVAGHTCDLFEPPAPSPHGYVVIYLHGIHLNRLADNEVFSRLFAEHGLRVIAPGTGRSFWTDCICPEFDPRISAERYVVEAVLTHVAERWGAQPPRIALLGTSMGGQGALRLAFKHPGKFPVVAAISPAIDYQLRYDDEGYDSLRAMYPDSEAARQDTATLHVHPLNWPRNIWFACDAGDWPWQDSAQKLRMKLAALGIPFECNLETAAGGHGFAFYNHMAGEAVGFLVERLERERLRVV